MKKLLSLFLSLSCLSAMAQFSVDSVANQTGAVEDLFLSNGIFVSNIAFIGDSAQMGWLTDGDSIALGVNDGLVLSTGVAANVSNGFNLPGGNWTTTSSTNTDLSTLTGYPTYDLAQLDFDFLATGDSMTFQFIFGSNEYPEWVGSGFNDIFGFFVSGPGISGTFNNNAVNLALVPGTNEVVSINTINPNQNSSLYVDNSSGQIQNLFCDAFTVPMYAAIGGLTVGESYHITLAITDVSDGALDSYVFLGGSSFQQFCTVNLMEEGSDRNQQCMLSQVKADLDYTVFCGTITLENQSQLNIDYSNAYYDMGDGNTIPANQNDVYSYTTPGNYTIRLVYQTASGFTSSYTLGTFPISEIMPIEPTIAQNGSVLSITNYNPSWLVSWFVSTDGGFSYVELEGVTTPSFDVNGVLPNGALVYAGISNGCLNNSQTQAIVGVNELRKPEFTVYPVPAHETLFFSNVNELKTVQVFDASGKLVQIENNVTSALNIANLAPGFYAIHVTNNKGGFKCVPVMVN